MSADKEMVWIAWLFFTKENTKRTSFSFSVEADYIFKLGRGNLPKRTFFWDINVVEPSRFSSG